MERIAPFLICGTMLALSVNYGRLVKKRRIDPALSTWLMFLAGTVLSLATFLSNSHWDFQAGILNTVDVLNVLIVLSCILIWGKVGGTRFDSFERYYLMVAAGIAIFWAVFRDSGAANLLSQGLIACGYFPMYQKMVRRKRRTESFWMWGPVIGIGIIASAQASATGNFLATIYAGRTVVMAGSTLTLMTYYTLRSSGWHKTNGSRSL